MSDPRPEDELGVVPGTSPNSVSLSIDGHAVSVPEGTTILDAGGGQGCGLPTLCYGDTITP